MAAAHLAVAAVMALACAASLPVVEVVGLVGGEEAARIVVRLGGVEATGLAVASGALALTLLWAAGIIGHLAGATGIRIGSVPALAASVYYVVLARVLASKFAQAFPAAVSTYPGPGTPGPATIHVHHGPGLYVIVFTIVSSLALLAAELAEAEC